MEFGERLAQLRNERGLSQSELAVRCGVHVSQLGRYESGASSPTLEVLQRICVGLGVSADQLVFGEILGAASDLMHIADAAAVLDADEQAIATGVIDALLYKHQAEARRKTRARPGPKPPSPTTSPKQQRRGK